MKVLREDSLPIGGSGRSALLGYGALNDGMAFELVEDQGSSDFSKGDAYLQVNGDIFMGNKD
jgi:hypothetical protein